MHDSNGTELKVGDRVTVEFEVAELQSGGDGNYCNVALKGVKHSDRANGDTPMEAQSMTTCTKFTTLVRRAAVATMLLLAFVIGATLSGCGTAGAVICASDFDPSNASQTADLLAKVDRDARLAANVAVAVLKADDVAKVRALLADVRIISAASPSDPATLQALAKPLIERTVQDPDKRQRYAAVVNAGLSVAVNFIPSPPPGSKAATVAAYAAWGQRVLLTALDAVLATLPVEKGGMQ